MVSAMGDPQIVPHPDVDSLSNAELRDALKDADENLEIIHKLAEGDPDRDPLLESWLVQERRLILAELDRRNGRSSLPLSAPPCLGKAGKPESGENLPLISSLELFQAGEDESIDWLVDDLIPKGTIVLLTAPPGSFKTWLALCLARSIAEGEPFLGRSVEAGQVSYIDKENPKSLVRERLRSIGASSNLKLWPLWADPEPPLLGDFSYPILSASNSLLIFDALRRFHTKNENAPDEMAIVMNHLRQLTKQGSTIIALHHSGKAEGNSYRGSTEILAGVDIAFELVKKKDETRTAGAPIPLSLRCIKHRFIEEPVLSLEFVNDGGKLLFRDTTAEIRGEAAETRREHLRRIQSVIVDLQRGGQPPNQSQLIAALKEKLNIGKNRALADLKFGEDYYWRTTTVDGAKLYQTLSHFPETVGEGKPETSESGWEDLIRESGDPS